MSIFKVLSDTTFFFCQVCLLNFHEAGKTKQIEKKSMHSQPVKWTFFTV